MRLPSSVPEPDDQRIPEPHGSPIEEIFAEAALRRAQRLAEGDSVSRAAAAPPEAIAALPDSVHPMNRFLSNRQARPRTMAGYRQRLKTAAALLVESGFREGAGIESLREFPWHRITVADAAALHRLAVKRYPNDHTRAVVLKTVRSMVRECARADLLDRRGCEQVLEALPVRVPDRPGAGRELSDDELVALQRAAAAHPNPVLASRNSAILAIFLSTGCRVSELSDLDLSDYRAGDHSLLFSKTKTNRPAQGWLAGWTVARVEHWLGVRGADPGPMFLGLNGDRLAVPGIQLMVKKLAAAAGLAERTSSHDFRRTFITRALRSGVDPFTVARLVNHRNVSTTMVYDRRTDLEDRQVVDRLQLPGFPTGHSDGGTSIEGRSETGR